jgi:hypothetical protein
VLELAAHGDWLPWLKDNFGWTVRTADKYMHVAEAFAKIRTWFQFGWPDD